MRSVAIIAAFTALINASAIPSFSNHTSYSYRTPSALSPQDDSDYDCKGSIMCSTLKVQACDEAINYKLIRDDNIIYGAARSGKPHLGVCHGIGTDYGCAIYIEGGSNCVRSGNDMWTDYQEIRNHHCHHCGHKHWDDGCSTTIDYEPECDRIRR